MVGYIPSEDPRYAFAIGRVRSREARMLNRQQFDRLLEARNESQMLSNLADTVYSETRAEDIDAMLARAAAEEEAFFYRYLEDETILDFFKASDQASNLKFSLRRKYGADVEDSLFISDASPSMNALAAYLEGEAAIIPDWMRDSLGKAVAANIENLDPSSIDLIVDAALIEHQHAVSGGYSFLEKLLSLRVDFTNLLTFLRIKVAGEEGDEFSRYFLPYGSVPILRFKAWTDPGWDSLPREIKKIEIFKKFEDGIKELPDSFLLLERETKEEELSYFLSARRLVFGYEPLVGYSLLKREERRNIQKVAAGIRYGLEKETIRKSIAWFD
jgi:V/A-type H+-transporting ATPase subunit C